MIEYSTSMVDNKDESKIFCASCSHLLSAEDTECPNCGFGTRTQPEPLSIGMVLEGRYRIDAVVGRGGTGVVYQGIDLTLSRRIAVKALLERAADPITLARFLHEARNLASVEHPGLVPVYAVGQEHGAHYMVMKYIDGSTLADVIKTQGALPELTVKEILIEACDALSTLHDAGLIHRDLKPANLMLGKDGRVSVVDLGIVQRVTEKHESTGQAAGTPKYMAPEMFSDQDITHRVDIYSLGIVGYHCLAGVPPFDGPTPMAILYKQAHEEPQPLSKLAPKLSQSMVSVIHRAMQKDPNERYGSARELAGALRGENTRSNTAPWLVAALAILGLVGAFLLFGQDIGSVTQPTPVDAAIAPVTQKPEEPPPRIEPSPQPERIKVEFGAGLPKTIQLEFEDGTQETTPYVIEKNKGSAPITFKASAAGYQTKEIQASFERNQYREIVLQRKFKAPSAPRNSGFQPMEYDD